MAELLFSTEAFCPLGHPIIGVPMLIDAEMRLIEPACAWLLHIALIRGRTRSPQTWGTYGEALHDWWQTLEANGWAWDQVTSDVATAWRNRMLFDPSSVTGRPYARSTINLRLYAVSQFYRWHLARGQINRRPFLLTELTAPAGDRRIPFSPNQSARQTLELTVRHKTALPRPLIGREVQLVFAQLGVRDRLMAEWAILAGLRRMEVAGLSLRALPTSHAASFEDAPMMPVRLTTTKGDRLRTVYPPLSLVDRTLAYVREERSVATRRARSRDPRYREPHGIFLTVAGKPITARRVGAMFKKACQRAGVPASFHSLRHSFATAMLGALQRQSASHPDINPLLTLQVMLGHADITTTQIYLRVVAADLDLIEGAVADLHQALR
ncbi:MAG TPA: tyrosine-type recombinase/integrase [Stellaceae bacterium]|nr:tyrosine-type recombinase/integrase [Stellaceae bacterium]